MKSAEFMSELDNLLSDMPEDERKEALEFYNDYLDDAGVENEESVIESFGTPESVAKEIKNSNQENAEYSENGYSNGKSSKDVPAYAKRVNESKSTEKNNEWTGNKLAILIVLLVIFSPFILAAVGSVVGIVFAILTCWIWIPILLLIWFLILLRQAAKLFRCT